MSFPCGVSDDQKNRNAGDVTVENVEGPEGPSCDPDEDVISTAKEPEDWQLGDSKRRATI